MRVSRVYQAAELDQLNKEPSFADDRTITLSADSFHHLIRVLKYKAGQSITVFDGQGSEQQFMLVNVEKKSARIQAIGDVLHYPCQTLKIHLGQVLSKGERMDYAIQKSVELGVQEITPLFSEHCDVKLPSDRIEKRLAHWKKVIISACEQCGQNWLPTVHPPASLKSWLHTQADIKWMLHTAPSTRAKPSKTHDKDRPITLAVLVGPEGGLSQGEVNAAQQESFTPMQFGSRVFRTETAPVVALSIAQNRWGDFNTE